MLFSKRVGQASLVPHLIALVMVVVSITHTLAQQVPVQPSSTHIFPAGGRRGTVVEVRVGGECLPPATRFHLHGDGVSAPEVLGDRVVGKYVPSPRRKPNETPTTYPSEWRSTITISDDAPLGPALWRLGSASGGTGARPFIVGDLPEFIEAEPNSTLAEAETVKMPATINGQIAGERDLDYFAFHAEAGTVISIDIAASRLGSPLDPVIQVFGPDGRRLNAQELRMGSDPATAFRPQQSGIYKLLVAGVSYKGGPQYVYRATISSQPLLQVAFPAGHRIGKHFAIEFLSPDGASGFLPITLPTDFPTAAGLFWRRSSDVANAIALAAGNLPEAVETGDNNSFDTAAALNWPLTMNGRFETPNDEDWYRVEVAAGKSLSIECAANSNWSTALPVLEIVDANRAVVSPGAPSPTGVFQTDWTAPAEGLWRLRVRDLQHGIRGGPSHVYRLTVRESSPEFTLSAKVDALNVVQGARGEIDVEVDRLGGFSAPIELSVEGLPTGVKLEGTTIPSGQPTVKLVFTADSDAPSCDATIRIRGRAMLGETAVEKPVLAAHLGRDPDGVALGPTTADHLQLTVVHKPVFRLYCNEAYQYAHRGTVYRYLMEIERLGDFKEPIHLEMADRQIKDLDGIEIVQTSIEPGNSQTMLPLYLPETMHINVQAHSNVYAQGHVSFVDAAGQKQSMLVVSTMRCMIRTLPTVVRLRAKQREFTAPPGAIVRVPLVLDRTPNFSGPLQVELVDPPTGVAAAPCQFEDGASETVIDIKVGTLSSQPAKLDLRIRGTGRLDEKAVVVSETAVTLKPLIAE